MLNGVQPFAVKHYGGIGVMGLMLDGVDDLVDSIEFPITINPASAVSGMDDVNAALSDDSSNVTMLHAGG